MQIRIGQANCAIDLIVFEYTYVKKKIISDLLKSDTLSKLSSTDFSPNLAL